MTIKEAYFGQEIRLSPNGIIYIKGDHQGMQNRYVNLRSKERFNTKCHRMSFRNKIESQETICYPVL